MRGTIMRRRQWVAIHAGDIFCLERNVFPGDRPAEGIVSFTQTMVVAVTQLKPLPIFIDVIAEIRDLFDAVHPKCCIVRLKNVLVDSDQNDPFRQPGDDPTQATEIHGLIV